MDKMEDVCFVKIWRSEYKFEWMVGSVYMNCEGVRKEENILKLESHQRSSLESSGGWLGYYDWR